MSSNQKSEIRNQKSVLLCPGQGAQHVGMGKAWVDNFPIAAELFREADNILGFSLSDVCFSGPEDKINRTDYSQPALYVTSVACYHALLESDVIDPSTVGATAGLSLGEFTALHLAGAFDFATGLRLVRLRGEAMQAAAEAVEGGSGMVALVGADEAQALALCEEVLNDPTATKGEVIVPANFNCPGQIVISGHLAACKLALTISEKMGLRATPLKVAGAFHSPLMQPAADRLAAALEHSTWSPLKVPVISNVTAQPHDSDPAKIKQLLVEQLTSPVRWSESMSYAIGNFPGRYIELAPNKVLSGLMRRIDRNVKVENHAEPA